MSTRTARIQQFPVVTVERTTCPREAAGMVLVPHPVYATMNPINFDAVLVYRAVATVSTRGPRRLNFEVDVLSLLDVPDEIMHAVNALEQQGWLLRVRSNGRTERWTPLGRDRAKLAPRTDLHVPILPPHRRDADRPMFGDHIRDAG